MSVAGERTQYLNLEQIERVCGAIKERLLVGNDLVVDALRRELISVSANGQVWPNRSGRVRIGVLDDSGAVRSTTSTLPLSMARTKSVSRLMR